MAKHNRFKAGQGAFQCCDCGRLTRDTGGDNGSVRLCPQCFEIAGIENSIADGMYETPEELEEAESEIKALRAQIELIEHQKQQRKL